MTCIVPTIIVMLVFFVITIYVVGVVLYRLQFDTTFVEALKWPTKRIDT